MRDPRDKDFPITHDGRFFLTVIVCLHSSHLPQFMPSTCMCTYLLQKLGYMHLYIGFLTKHEVKMVGYWPSSFARLWTTMELKSLNVQEKNGLYSGILAGQAWSIKDLLLQYRKRMSLFSCGMVGNPNRARKCHLACPGSQSHLRIQFILTSNGATCVTK